MEKRLINGEKLEKSDVRSRKTGFGMGLFAIFTIVCVLFAMSFVAAADSTGKLQIWRNKTTGTNVGWIDNNGNVDFSGVISGDGSGITNLNIDVAAINYWNKSGNNLFYNDGNVGIGTTNPGYKLDVVGNVNINEGSSYMYDGVHALRLSKGTDTYYTNTLVGNGAGNITAYRQTAIGSTAGYLNTGKAQTAIGFYAGRSNIGDYQTAMGYFAGYANKGNHQTAIGYLAGRENTGASQIVMGHYAGYENTGEYQTALGYYAGFQNTGARQTVMGMDAGYKNTGTYQTAMGMYAGMENVGDRVSSFGYGAARNNSGRDVVAIGYKAGENNVLNNQFIVQQENVNAIPLIQGDFATGDVNIAGDLCLADGTCLTDVAANASDDIWSLNGSKAYYNNGNVGIGTDNPKNKLDVKGAIMAYDSETSLANGYFAKMYSEYGKKSLVLESRSGKVLSTEGYGRETVLYSDGAERIRINPAGNVGIGTTEPGAKLEVAQGNILLSNGRALSWKNSAGTKINLIKYDNANNLIVNNGNSAAGRIDLEIGSKKRLSIDGDKVGINNENPTKELDVNGTAKVEELNVKNARMFIDSEGDMVFRV